MKSKQQKRLEATARRLLKEIPHAEQIHSMDKYSGTGYPGQDRAERAMKLANFQKLEALHAEWLDNENSLKLLAVPGYGLMLRNRVAAALSHDELAWATQRRRTREQLAANIEAHQAQHEKMVRLGLVDHAAELYETEGD